MLSRSLYSVGFCINTINVIDIISNLQLIRQPQLAIVCLLAENVQNEYLQKCIRNS